MLNYLLPTSLIVLISLAGAAGLTLFGKKQSFKESTKSTLARNLLFWLVIYVIFVVFTLSNQIFQLLVMIYVLYKIRQEVLENIKIEKWFEVLCYAIAVLIGIVSIWLASSMSIENTIALLLGSAFALSFPNLHNVFKLKAKLIKKIYDNVTVEILIARLIGAFVGVLVVWAFVSPVSLWLALPIAIGITAGEFVNIKVKKMLDIEFWSDTIPGHGGFLDRFSTLSYAAIIVLIVQYF